MTSRVYGAAVMVAIVVATSPLAVWAQEEAAGDAPTSGAINPDDKSYVNQYALVMLLTALGIILICRPSKRAPEPKPLEQYVD